MRFKYRARTKEGELQVGFIDAPNREGAVRVLTSHDLFILLLDRADKTNWYDAISHVFTRASLRDVMIFTRQFATLLEARVPLNEALKTLSRQTQNPELHETAFQVQEDIDAGLALSQALERHSAVFSPFYVNMIRSAELTGRLDEAMTYLADHLEREVALSGRIKNALIYPIVTVILFFVVAGVMVAYVLPQIEPVFLESGIKLPALTKALIGAGRFISNWWWAVLAALGGAGMLAADYLRTGEGRALYDEFVLHLPVFKKLYRELAAARFSESVSILIKGGIPVAQAIEVASQTIGSAVYGEVLRDVSAKVRQGKLLSQALAEHERYMPILVAQMVAIGESTGKLDDLLLRISKFYSREVENVVANLVELIQPSLMVVIGLMIGLLFASIIVPIYNLSQSF